MCLLRAAYFETELFAEESLKMDEGANLRPDRYLPFDFPSKIFLQRIFEELPINYNFYARIIY